MLESCNFVGVLLRGSLMFPLNPNSTNSQTFDCEFWTFASHDLRSNGVWPYITCCNDVPCCKQPPL